MIPLDKNYMPIGEIDDFKSLILHKEYYATGRFELHTPNKIYNAVYVYINDFGTQDIGVIEGIDIDGNGVIYYGRLQKSLLNNKVIRHTKVFYNKTPEYIAKELVKEFGLQEITVEPVQGLGTPVTIQVTGDNLLEFTDKLLQTQELSATIDYDYVNNTLIYKVYKGVDNTQKQPLSDNFDNVSQQRYTRNSETVKNYAYVAGEVTDGQPRTIVEVDIRDTPSEEKRELWVDARDLQSEIEQNGETVIIPQQEYRDMLTARGKEKLAECTTDEECDFTPINIELSLGELRYYVNHYHGIESVQRVTELMYALEDHQLKKSVVWGDKKIRRNKNV